MRRFTGHPVCGTNPCSSRPDPNSDRASSLAANNAVNPHRDAPLRANLRLPPYCRRRRERAGSPHPYAVGVGSSRVIGSDVPGQSNTGPRLEAKALRNRPGNEPAPRTAPQAMLLPTRNEAGCMTVIRMLLLTPDATRNVFSRSRHLRQAVLLAPLTRRGGDGRMPRRGRARSARRGRHESASNT